MPQNQISRIPTIAPTIVATRLTCSFVIIWRFSNNAPRILSIKPPTVPDITETKIADNGFATIPKKNAAIPMIAAPTMPTAVPSVETAPLVPGSTFWKVVISLGGGSNTPI